MKERLAAVAEEEIYLFVEWSCAREHWKLNIPCSNPALWKKKLFEGQYAK